MNELNSAYIKKTGKTEVIYLFFLIKSEAPGILAATERVSYLVYNATWKSD